MRVQGPHPPRTYSGASSQQLSFLCTAKRAWGRKVCLWILAPRGALGTKSSSKFSPSSPLYQLVSSSCPTWDTCHITSHPRECSVPFPDPAPSSVRRKVPQSPLPPALTLPQTPVQAGEALHTVELSAPPEKAHVGSGIWITVCWIKSIWMVVLPCGFAVSLGNPCWAVLRDPFEASWLPAAFSSLVSQLRGNCWCWLPQRYQLLSIIWEHRSPHFLGTRA